MEEPGHTADSPPEDHSRTCGAVASLEKKTTAPVLCGTACNRRNISLTTLPRWGLKVLPLATIPVPRQGHFYSQLTPDLLKPRDASKRNFATLKLAQFPTPGGFRTIICMELHTNKYIYFSFATQFKSSSAIKNRELRPQLAACSE